MKKLLFFLVAMILMASCASYESCPTYGNTNKITKYGYKAQSKYSKKRI